MEANTLVYTLADTLKEAKAERVSHTLGNVEMEALIDPMADTLFEKKAKTLIKTLGGVEAMKVV